LTLRRDIGVKSKRSKAIQQVRADDYAAVRDGTG
jgi:hypothetical protein